MTKIFIYVLLGIVATSLLNVFLGGMMGYAIGSFILAILFFIGKGDNLISGYNTASEEEKELYNIKRLRLVMGVFCLLMAGLIAFIDAIGVGIFVIIMTLMVVPLLVLCNTWAMKK
ncbi:MAG: DUF3784 domain-containing protein [Bacteroidaceae bacterium]|nr:DUF3784 domain-containing protein [Bacteroidaceae bacterium]